MNSFVNEAYLATQLSNAKRMRRSGIMSLAGAFLLPLVSGYSTLSVLVAYPLMFLAFWFMTSGGAQVRRLTARPRADQAIEAELKGFSQRTTLHSFPMVSQKVVKHILVTPGALVVMESNDALGSVECKGGKGGERWHTPRGFLDRMSGLKPPVGDPGKDLEASMAAARSLLEEIGKPDVPVEGLIVFTRSPEIRVEECAHAAVPLDELKATLRQRLYELGGERAQGDRVERILTTEERRKLNAMLSPQSREPQPKAKPAVARK